MAVDDPLIGKKLGDYTIQHLLGRGGMSRVYRGYDENLDRYAAVKVISGDLAATSEEEYMRRFQSEARAIAHLRHPNIVGIYQFGRSEGIYYMAQVFLEGTDLRTLLKEYADRGRRMPYAEIVRIARDVASALDYAHQQGVIHRDVKPSNILLERRTGRAILMDFGLALSVFEGSMGDTFGSAHYIAPEQAVSSARAVPQSDLYSLGVVLYEMVTGTVPFDDPSAMSVALKHLNQPPPPPTTHNPDLPPAIEAVILRALAKNPAHRYATGRELVSALDQAVRAAQPHEPHDTPSVLDLLEAQPSRVDEARRRTPSRPLPSAPPAPPSVVDQTAGGLAGRFARRRAAKAAQQPLTERDLQLDEETLDSLLESLPDPREIGLVGPGVRPITLPERPLSAAPVPRRQGGRRRARLALLLLTLVATILAGAFWFNTQRADQDRAAGQTATAVAGASDSSPTPDGTLAAATLTARPADGPSATPAATLPGSATATGSAGTPGASVPGQQPDIRLVYDGERFLLINISGAPLDISRLVFEQALADGSVRAFRASTWDRAGIADSPAEMRAGGCYELVTADAAPTAPDSQICPQFLGYFQTTIAQRYFWIASSAGAQFTVRYEGETAPLATCAIEAGECAFDGGVAPAPTPTPSATLTRTSTRTPTATPSATSTPAPTLAPSATPTVTPSPTPTALPSPTLTQAPSATPSRMPTASPSATPTATSTPVPDLRLIFTDEQFLLVNVAGRELDVSGLVFEQVGADGSLRQFAAAEWDRPDILAPPARMSAGGCYLLLTAEGTQTLPADEICSRFLGWFRTGVPRRYFWIADGPGATFVVRRADEETPLATCAIDAGECGVALPAQPE